MKLAEALSIRKDLQKRIQQFEQRIKNNVKVQEDDEPLEDPKELMKELHSCLIQLEELIGRINLTNLNTKNAEGQSITQLMAKKDTLTLRIGILRNIYSEATTSLTATPLRRYDRSVSLMLSSLASRLTSTLVVCASSTWRFRD